MKTVIILTVLFATSWALVAPPRTLGQQSAARAGEKKASPQPEPYRSANVCVDTLAAEGDFETGLWHELVISYRKMTDEDSVDARRVEILDRLIELNKKRLAALERLRKWETGR